MEKVVQFLKDAEVYYLATVDGDQPRVRPFGAVCEFFKFQLLIMFHQKFFHGRSFPGQIVKASSAGNCKGIFILIKIICGKFYPVSDGLRQLTISVNSTAKNNYIF